MQATVPLAWFGAASEGVAGRSSTCYYSIGNMNFSRSMRTRQQMSQYILLFSVPSLLLGKEVRDMSFNRSLTAHVTEVLSKRLISAPRSNGIQLPWSLLIICTRVSIGCVHFRLICSAHNDVLTKSGRSGVSRGRHSHGYACIVLKKYQLLYPITLLDSIPSCPMQNLSYQGVH